MVGLDGLKRLFPTYDSMILNTSRKEEEFLSDVDDLWKYNFMETLCFMHCRQQLRYWPSGSSSWGRDAGGEIRDGMAEGGPNGRLQPPQLRSLCCSSSFFDLQSWGWVLRDVLQVWGVVPSCGLQPLFCRVQASAGHLPELCSPGRRNNGKSFFTRQNRKA